MNSRGIIDLSRDGPVATLRFANPGRHNAISLSMWELLPGTIDAIEADRSIRVVVLRGAGEEAFVSGADVSEFDSARDTDTANARYESLGAEALARIARCSRPTIARLRGWCLGAGMAIALSCDLRLADASVRFGIPAARLGIAYRWPGVKRLIEVVGAANARRVLLTGNRFDAGDALAMGFAHRVVDPEQLDAELASECGVLAKNAPLTMAAAKSVVDELCNGERLPDIGRMEAATDRAFASRDFVEGRRAFLEKRQARFEGI